MAVALAKLSMVDETDTELDSVLLASSGNYLLSYKVVSSEPSQITYSTPLRNGSEYGIGKYNDVNEQMNVLLTADSVINLQFAYNQIEKFLHFAIKRQSIQRGNRIFLVFQHVNGDEYRTEIKRGKIQFTDKGGDVGWVQLKAEVQISFTRSYYWESTAKIAVALTSKANVTPITTGVTVYNHGDSDSGHATWFQIASSQIEGSINHPIEFHFENTYNDANRVTRMYVGMHDTGDVATYDPILQGESATWIGGATTDSSADYANGQAKTYTWVHNNEFLAATWTLTGAQLNAAQGLSVRVLAKIINPSSHVYGHLKIKYLALSTLDQTQEIQLDDNVEFQDFGILKLPPWQTNGDTPADLVLELYLRAVSSSHFITLDFLHLTPLDGWAEYRSQGYGLAYQYILVDNGLNNRLVVESPSNTEAGYFVKRPRQPTEVSPLATKFYIICDNEQIMRTTKVTAYYRKRTLGAV
jgi:hypothetical protein